MIKTINGVRYNTNTAKAIETYWNLIPKNDFEYFEETLYQTNSGYYFLYGKGGPMSKYAKPVGRTGWENGERIVPLNWKEVNEWARSFMDEDEHLEFLCKLDWINECALEKICEIRKKRGLEK